MSQHDYVIANGTGAAVRSDLNNALAAIVSNNSGATEPATMYAYQWWADTSTGLLKLRNAANNAWITLRELDGTLTIEDGTASSPGLAFADDLNTGIYSPSADQLGITTGGTVRLTTTTTGITSALPVDVPLGTASAPTVTFTGDLNTGIYSPGADQVAISTNGTQRLTVDTAATTSTLPVVHPLGAVGTPSITFTGDLNTGIWSPAADTIAFSEGGVEAMRIDSSGRVGIGTSPSTLLHLASADPVIRLQDTDTNGYGQITVDNGGSVYIQADEANTQASSSIRLNVDGTERARIDSSGRLLVGTSSAPNGGDGQYSRLVVQGNTVASSAYFSLSRNQAATSIASGNDLGLLCFTDNAGNSFGRIECYADATPGTNDYPGRLVFSTCADGASSPTERMRITNQGWFKASNTGTYIDATAAYHEIVGNVAGATLNIRNTASSGTRVVFVRTPNASESGTDEYLFVGGTNSDRVYIFNNGNIKNTNNSYGAISDVKLKENIIDAGSQWDDIKSLQVRKYNFKEGQTHTQIGLIAQEVEQVSPGLVSESPDRDADGNDLGTVTKSINYSVLYMKAVKALQEAMERIEQLEAKVASLETA